MTLLAASSLRVRRGEKLVLRDVSLEVRGGEVVGVLGPSGAGKSTLFGALTGELAIEGGSVHLGGDDVTRRPLWERARAGLGYVPQTPSVLWDLTVRENLAAYLAVARPKGALSPESLAARVAVGERMDVRAGELSGGERRRLELARALSIEPKVLVCDEPFAGVDPQGAKHLGELLRSLAEDGVAVVLADHHVEEALSICTRALLLLDGKVEAEGTPDAFVRHPLVRGRYLGTLRAPSLAPNLAEPSGNE